MTPEQLALLSDARLSADARVLGLYIASRGEAAEIERDDFRRILSGAGKNRVASALGELELWKYIQRTTGGRGHSDSFQFRAPETETLSDSVHEMETLSADSVSKVKTLNGTPSSTTTSPPSPPPTARVNARPADTDLARLRTYLGDHARAVDLMLDSADHPSTWAAAIIGKYLPGAMQEGVFGGIGPDRRPAVLASAITDYATKGKPYGNKYFDGFVRDAANSERRGPIGRRDDGGAAAQSGSPPRAATGTDGGRRSGWVYE